MLVQVTDHSKTRTLTQTTQRRIQGDRPRGKRQPGEPVSLEAIFKKWYALLRFVDMEKPRNKSNWRTKI